MLSKRALFRSISVPLVKVMRLDRASRLSCELAEELQPLAIVRGNGVVIRMDCPTELARYRADSFFTKEPETIAWIDAMRPGETMLDIGANVGVYSLYAAAKGLRVFSIEPETQNVALLNRNIFLNLQTLGPKITAFNVALSDRDGIDELHLTRMYSGAALHNLGASIDYAGRPFAAALRQGVVSYTADTFVSLLEQRYPGAFPSHVKIDVDGIEAKIIRGAARTLGDTRLQSLLIELDESSDVDRAMRGVIESHGLRLASRHPTLTPAGAKPNPLTNCIFRRD